MQERSLRRKDKSTIGKSEYISDYILFGATFGYSTYKLLPVVAPIAYYHQSFMRLVLCMMLASVIGIGLSFKYNRTNTGTFCDIIAGIGSYILITIGAYKPGMVKAIVIVCAVFTAIGIYAIFANKIKRPDKIKQIIRNRIRCGFMLIRRNAVVACAVALFVIPAAVHFTSDEKIVDSYYYITGTAPPALQFADEYEVVQAYGDGYKLSENIDVIRKLRNNDEFQSLSYEEKCEVVEAVTYCEARYLGLCKINLKFEELGDSTLGLYNHSTRTITINSKPLKDGTMNGGSNEEVLATICHEARHCYQYLLAECYANSTPEERNLYAFTNEGVAGWIENMKNYNTFDNGEYASYRNQPLEEDARNWAHLEVMDFFYYIDKYTEKSADNE